MFKKNMAKFPTTNKMETKRKIKIIDKNVFKHSAKTEQTKKIAF